MLPTTETNNNGDFSFFSLEDGNYKIKVEKTGYTTETIDYQYPPSSGAPTIRLTPVGGCQTNEIPEYPTIALPVISIIGLTFLLHRRKGK
ncbi:MAG: PEF-CTERM sorting domain-containing protein [Methanococcoides sp.]|nr:PEF-CTERM sorting domain-containing protein [Methanococcoides sp.]